MTPYNSALRNFRATFAEPPSSWGGTRTGVVVSKCVWLKWKAKLGQRAQPGLPKAGRSFGSRPACDNTFIRAGRNTLKLKFAFAYLGMGSCRVDKHDVDYIALHCATRNELSPALKRGKKWYSLDFSFEEKVILDKVSRHTQRVLVLILGSTMYCVCSVMDSTQLSSADVLRSCR